MKTSQKGISLIKSFETLRLEAYKCPAGVWTIGYGHTRGVKPGQKITQAQADVLLRGDLLEAEMVVNAAELKLNQNQYDALASFVFNVGVGAFGKSTLLKMLRANPDNPAVRDEFAKWKYSKGKPLPGLVRRRKAEADLYFS